MFKFDYIVYIGTNTFPFIFPLHKKFSESQEHFFQHLQLATQSITLSLDRDLENKTKFLS